MAGLKGITVNTAPEAEPHIYAEDDAAVFQTMFGEDGVSSIGQACKATVLSNNKVRVADGVICVGGHFARIPYGEYEDCEIANGQSGKNRNDIIVARFETTGTGGIDTYTCEVKQGTPGDAATDPELTQDNLYNGGKVRELPLYRVKMEGISIVAVEQMFDVVPTNAELIKTVTELNGKIPFSTVLYDNTSGTKTDATLSDNVTNYEYVEIFYGNDLNGNDAYMPMRSIKTILKDGYARARLLWFGSASNSANHQFSRLALELHDNTIHFGSENFVNFPSTAGSVKWSSASTKHFKIFRVIGWKH